MRILVLIHLLLISAVQLSAQSDADRAAAKRLAADGVREAEGGRYERALVLLDQAARLDPSEPGYRYELAYACFQKHDDKRAVEIMTKLVANPKASDRWYQLLGDAQEHLGDHRKAAAAYNAGLKRFPASGSLWMALGTLAMNARDQEKALKCWESGIGGDPGFALNYYHASRACCALGKRMWGIIYGEVFVNLEPATARAKEISALVYEAYRKSLTLGDSVRAEFSPAAPSKGKRGAAPAASTMVVPFNAIHALTSVKYVEGEDGRMSVDTALTLARLGEIRAAFIDEWYKRDLPRQYSNALFEWQKQLLDGGHMQAYTYWLLAEGAPEEFRAWRMKNNDKLDAFIRAIVEHPIRVNREHSASRPTGE